MNSHYDFRPIKNVVDFHQKLIFISSFKPNEKALLKKIKDKKKLIREEALSIFHNYYSQKIEHINGQNIWLSGGVPSYKLIDIRKIVTLIDAKINTRETQKTTLVVIGDKTKLEELPKNLPYISAIAFEAILKGLEEKVLDAPKQEKQDETLIELLLTNELTKIEEAFRTLEEQGISLTLLPLIFAIFKVHQEKEIRTKAKELLLKESSKTSKDVMAFCEKRNYLNAKYSVGMEDLAKIKGFNIELFLYYLVVNQKNNLGKEYLASLDGQWSRKLIEEHELLNKKALILYGKAGESFLYAKKIESFTVHALSSVLWKMDWLKELTIVDIKQKIELPKYFRIPHLKSLTLETKELTLAGDLPISHLTIERCKLLTIDNSFKLSEIKTIKLKDCSFSFSIFQEFLEKSNFEKLKKIELYDFVAYKLPKNLKEEFKKILPNVKLIVNKK